jgi:hypothetical protein
MSAASAFIPIFGVWAPITGERISLAERKLQTMKKRARLISDVLNGRARGRPERGYDYWKVAQLLRQCCAYVNIV